MKKQITILVSVLVVTITIIILLLLPTIAPKPKADGIRIGVCVYDAKDTFISSMVNEIDRKAKKHQYDTGETVTVNICDSQENQRQQNEQVARYIALGYDVICINPVDRTNISAIIDAGIEADIPIVFFNREPVQADIFRSSNLYYVGSDAKQSGVLQGEILAYEWQKNKDMIDANKNNTLEYAMLEGESGHQDAIIRTKWSIETINQNGIKTKMVADGVANWDRSQASAMVEQWITDYPNQIEAIICNNDDMALGAYDALQRLEVQNIPILGVDATADGVKAVQEGKLLGTVDCNAKQHGQRIFEIAYAVAQKRPIPNDIILEQDKYLRIKLSSVTKEQ